MSNHFVMHPSSFGLRSAHTLVTSAFSHIGKRYYYYHYYYYYFLCITILSSSQQRNYHNVCRFYCENKDDLNIIARAVYLTLQRLCGSHSLTLSPSLPFLCNFFLFLSPCPFSPHPHQPTQTSLSSPLLINTTINIAINAASNTTTIAIMQPQCTSCLTWWLCTRSAMLSPRSATRHIGRYVL